MSSKHERLLELYTQVLATVDIKPVDELGKLSYISPADPEDSTPAAVKGKRLVLPTREALRLPEFWESHCAFHPLSENFLNGESPVLQKLKAMINLKLGAVTAELMSWLVSYAADPERQNTGHVSAGASKYLKLVPNIKQVTSERFAEIIKKSSGSNDKRFVNLYLRRGGDLLDSRYQWVCTATFPFRQDLEGEEPKVFGVKISKKDQESLKALFDYILPDNDDIATYSAGSKIKSACKFDATLRAFAKIAERLNEVITLHKKIIPSYKDLKIDVEWILSLSELDKLADVVPALPMNEGESMRDRRTEGSAVVTSTSEKARRVLTSVDPVKEEIEAPVRTERVVEVTTTTPMEAEKETVGSSFGDRMAARHRQETSRGGYQHVAPNRNYGQPAHERVPDWAGSVAEGKGVKIAGDPDRLPYQVGGPQNYATGGGNYRTNNSQWGAQNERVHVLSSQGQVARGPARRQNQNFDL